MACVFGHDKIMGSIWIPFSPCMSSYNAQMIIIMFDMDKEYELVKGV